MLLIYFNSSNLIRRTIGYLVLLALLTFCVNPCITKAEDELYIDILDSRSQQIVIQELRHGDITVQLRGDLHTLYLYSDSAALFLYSICNINAIDMQVIDAPPTAPILPKFYDYAFTIYLYNADHELLNIMDVFYLCAIAVKKLLGNSIEADMISRQDDILVAIRKGND